ncbi:Copia protein, partial [Mucuna pruriens]
MKLYHPEQQIISNFKDQVRTHSTFKDEAQVALLSEVEPKNNDVWKLVSPPKDKFIIGTKWIFRNTLDQNGKVVQNKAKLVVQGYSQQERIDFIKTFSPIARLEVIHILLSFTYHHNMRLHQIDALYGLKQAPHAWYDKLSSFLMTNGFQRRKVYITLFHKNYDSHFIIVQIYKEKEGTYIHQSKYIKELLKKFNLEDCKTMSTLMHPTSILSLDETHKKVNQTPLDDPIVHKPIDFSNPITILGKEWSVLFLQQHKLETYPPRPDYPLSTYEGKYNTQKGG